MALFKKKSKYYSLKKILERNAQYNLIYGERSNGKTFAVQEECFKRYWETGAEMAIIRRWREDFRGKRGQQMFDALCCDADGKNHIEEITEGEWTGIYYYSGRWYLSRTNADTEKLEKAETPFCYGFALTDNEHDKSTSYPRIRNILFDEFLSRTGYLPDEFVLFMNTLSTIIRQRNDVTIFMCGNTINKFCPYFKEMGLTHIQKMTQGDIEVYSYGESKLKVAVEFSDSPNKDKPSNVYFAFDNPKLSMITGKGNVWEMAIYPHCPCKILPKMILFTYFIIFEGTILQCEIVQDGDNVFTFIHQKTTELKDTDNDLIYDLDYNPKPNYRRNILKATSMLEKKVLFFFQTDKVFYQDNEIGEIVRNYLQYCRTDKGILN